MNEYMDVFTSQADFSTALGRLPAGRWEPQPGITLQFQQLDSPQQERRKILQLALAPGKRYPGMLRQILQRRFLEAETIAEWYLSLDERQNLLLRCVLPVSDDLHQQVIADLWRLAGLPAR
ncbi:MULTISPECIES: type III secretion protein [unclassified Brenneria]|uniref:type III secretion protein n=1 Tax=unclassified Brenneria TaxID=2634434 RepID=UPI0018F0BABC|nr:type III secretion protein [Brenneria sp. L3-3C-1]MBJ7220882.1 type III secretion protein [Brenneria sp. L3-3C-1]MEE3642122.1 type III secretion protein [Brenneria sp. L3_3C_1]